MTLEEVYKIVDIICQNNLCSECPMCIYSNDFPVCAYGTVFDAVMAEHKKEQE